jgi:hypothetical protein
MDIVQKLLSLLCTGAFILNAAGGYPGFALKDVFEMISCFFAIEFIFSHFESMVLASWISVSAPNSWHY